MAEGFHGGVLWGFVLCEVFMPASYNIKTSRRIYPNEYRALGDVPGMDGDALREYDDIARDAIALAEDMGNSRRWPEGGVVCVVGLGSPSVDHRDEPTDVTRQIWPDENGTFQVLFWKPNREVPFFEKVMKGDVPDY